MLNHTNQTIGTILSISEKTIGTLYKVLSNHMIEILTFKTIEIKFELLPNYRDQICNLILSYLFDRSSMEELTPWTRC